MQNIEIKYPSHSPQAEYLAQFDLIEEDQLTEQREETSFHFQTTDLSFQENQDDYSDPEDELDFHQFVKQRLKIKSWINKESIVIKIQRLILFMVGQQLQYEHLMKRQNKHNKDLTIKHPNQLLWILLAHIFILFGIAWTLHLPTLIVLSLILISITEKKHESQLQLLQNLPKDLNWQLSKLKLYFLSHHKPLADRKAFIDSILSNLLKSIEHMADINLNPNLNQLDNLQELIHNILTSIKQQRLSLSFLTSSCLKRKWIYWKVQFYNKQLKQVIETLEQTIKTIDLYLSQQKKEIYPKQQSKQNIYFELLANKINSLEKVSQPSELEKKEMKKAIQLLKKQIDFRKILNVTHQQPKEASLEDTHSIEEKNEVFQPQNKEHKSLIYLEDHAEEYTPQNYQSIREKLDHLLQQKQRKSDLQKQKSLSQVVQQSQPANFSTLRKERISFGIPILPPQRDMSAYYIE